MKDVKDVVNNFIEYSFYISGAITGNPDAEKQFKEAEKKLNSIAHNVSIFNPYEEAKKFTKAFYFGIPTWSDYMRFVLPALLKSNRAYFLKGWRNSQGALLEHALCEQLDIKIVEEE